ncbi:MAG: J domain-containing protein [Cyanobacteriota bacterium]|nr:J domain-containing protein [Cyanobacteriota bacterium]
MPTSSAPPDPDPSQGTAEPGGREDLEMAGTSFYALLQVSAAATPEQLRQSFRRLSKRYHPDTTTLPPPEAAQAFQRLRQAYAVLGDPQARRLYDERLRLQPRAAGPATAFNASSPPPAAGPASIRRTLSGGEWFALLLLAIALVLSLVLGIGVAWARGAELVRWPSWWAELHPADPSPRGAEAAPGDGIVEGPQSRPLTAVAPDVPAP